LFGFRPGLPRLLLPWRETVGDRLLPIMEGGANAAVLKDFVLVLDQAQVSVAVVEMDGQFALNDGVGHWFAFQQIKFTGKLYNNPRRLFLRQL